MISSRGTLFAYTAQTKETKWELGQPDTPISEVTAWNWFDLQETTTFPPEAQPPIYPGRSPTAI